MQCVTSVDPLWLAKLGSVYFYIKEEGVTKSEQRRREKKEMEDLEVQREEMEKRKREKEEEDERNRPAKKRKVVEVGGARTRGQPRLKKRIGL